MNRLGRILMVGVAALVSCATPAKSTPRAADPTSSFDSPAVVASPSPTCVDGEPKVAAARMHKAAGLGDLVVRALYNYDLHGAAVLAREYADEEDFAASAVEAATRISVPLHAAADQLRLAAKGLDAGDFHGTNTATTKSTRLIKKADSALDSYDFC